MQRIIAVHTMKGGAGKSTVTVIAASYLAYVARRSVVIIDADPPQYSVSALRNREIESYSRLVRAYTAIGDLALIEPGLATTTDKAMFRRLAYNLDNAITEDSLYKIFQTNPSSLSGVNFSTYPLDYVFLDMAGRQQESIVDALIKASLILIPFTTQQIDINASISYCVSLIQQHKAGRIDLSRRQLVCFWNKHKFFYDKAAAILEEQILNLFNEVGLAVSFMKNRLPDADTGFDQHKMFTTVSSPFVQEGGNYLYAVEQFIIEMCGLLGDVVTATIAEPVRKSINSR